AHDTVQSVLLKCEDQEQCYTHPYVKDRASSIVISRGASAAEEICDWLLSPASGSVPRLPGSTSNFFV
ncbi:unnamed protein product, partial [Polarella glacialis]